MAFLLGNQIVLSDTETGHLSKLQINGTDVLTLDGSTITLKNVDIADSIEGSINSDNVAEGSTNRFFTAARETVLTTADSTATTDRALIRTEFAAADSTATTDRGAIRTEFAAADSTATTDRGAIRTEFATADSGITTALQSYADTAEADAVSTASVDATTKANAAQTAAQSFATAADTSQTTSINTAWAAGDATTLASAQSYADSVVATGTGSLDTDDITEAGNLYYTDARADTRATLRINDATTDNIDEGSNNLYYTDTRADARAQLKIDALVDSAPGTLDTLNELAAALGDDANHVTTMTNLIGAEATTARAAEGVNATAIGAEATTARAAETVLTVDVAANTAAITTNILGVAANVVAISTEEGLRVAGDIALDVRVTANEAVGLSNTLGIAANVTAISALNHDTLSGFVANEHIDWTAASAGTIDPSNYTNTGNTTYTAGTGLTLVGTEFQNTITNNNQLTNGAGYITTDTNTTYTAGNGMTLTGTEFLMSGSYTGSFTATGDVTAYSDERLKRNIETINKPLDIVNALRGVKFEKDGRHSTGVIAQEVEKVLPEVVHTDAEGMKSVAYGNVVGVLIEAIKEQQKQIDWLTAFWQSDAERDSFNKD